MTVPAGMPVDEYQTQLLYRNKNTKEVKSFTLENYPWQDTLNWEWVETKSVLVKKGYEPPIHDFDLTDSHGNNLNDSILNFKGYVFLFISDKLNKVDTKSLFFADTLSMFCSSNPNTRFYALTASTEHEQQKIIKQFNLSFTFGNGDETMLKTVIRSNPGIVILSNGTVIAKYSHHDFYKIKFKNDELILSSVLTSQRQKTEILYSFIFIFLLILLTFFIKEYLVPEN